MRFNHVFMLALPVALVAIVGWQPAVQPPAPPPVHPLGPVIGTNQERLTNAVAVRELPNGRVLVNENGRGVRRLIMFDSVLANPVFVFDSAAGMPNYYGGSPAMLIPYRGDSSFLVTNTPGIGVAMALIDPTGKMVTVRALPRPQDGQGASPLAVVSAYDGKGRLVYRAPATPGVPTRDSAAIARADPITRMLDTAGWVRIATGAVTISRDPQGNITGVGIGALPGQLLNPLPTADEWAVLPDGSIAFLRGKDYHIDWINPDGSKTSTAPMAFTWQRLGDVAKVAVRDSAQAALDSAMKMMDAIIANARAQAANATPAADGGGRGAAAPAGGGGGAVRGGGDGGAGGAGAPAQAPANIAPPTMMPASQLPDARPPFTTGALRADMDNNLWVRTTTSSMADGFIYDVINRKGVVIDRVRTPPNATIIGFGKSGVVYLTGTDAAGFHLYKMRAR